ncbi:hypothetical protein MKW94_018141 [Papaver nudicaule]|uniref:PWI domain-containing protein n=1 Tax=Papaver nudicaule TaxID=74823 RepID=A0AA41SHP4_PAPNU|nr:hypothetical protein [Papaver nudicaule]
MLPMTKEVFNYDMNWEVVDKYALHEKMRPWISNIAKNSTVEEAEIVYCILLSMENHGSALSVRKKIMSFQLVNDFESERLFLNTWAMLFSEIKKLEEVDGKKPSSGVEIFNGTPKTNEEVLSLEINWTVFDQHKLHEKMRPWIKKEVRDLLKKEKASVLDEVVDGIRRHYRPSKMLELFQPSLDVDTETVVRILWRTLLILVKIFETEMCSKGFSSILLFTSYLNLLSISKAFIFFLFETGFAASTISISGANPITELSSVEGIPSDDNLCQQDPVWNDEKSTDPTRFGNTIPRNIEELSSYVVDWDTSDREELHNRLRPWIFREIKEFVREDEAATPLAESIVSGIKEHANAKDILELVKPSLLGDRSVTFVVALWIKLLFGIHLSNTTGITLRMAFMFSRNRHFMMVAFDYDNLLKLKRISEEMPKTKGELFSYEIKWDVYEKHELQRNMREGMWIETLEFIRRKKEAMLVDEQIMWSIFDYHVSASQREFTAREEAIPVFEEIMSTLHKDLACPYKMVDFLEPKLGSGAEKFVMRMWYALICGIKFAEARVEKKWNGRRVVLLPVKDQDL